MDLGEFSGDSSEVFGTGDGYENYYATFGEITAISKGWKNTFDVESSLLNERTVKDLTWDESEGDKEVPSKQYVYVAIPLNRDINIDDLVLFVRSSEVATVKRPRPGEDPQEPEPQDAGILSIKAFVLENEFSLPEKPRFFGDPLYEEITVPDEATGGTRTKIIEIEYDDPPFEEAVASTTTTVKNNEWTSFMLSSWTTGEGNSTKISLKNGNVLLLYVENNSGGNDYALPLCSFQFLDLIVRAVE